MEHCGLEESYGAAFQPAGDLRVVRRFRELLKPGGVLLLTVPFGRKGRNEGQRVYDADALSRLLEGFDVQSRLFYVLGRDQQWTPSDPDGMKDVDSLAGRTRGVALVRAAKPPSA